MSKMEYGAILRNHLLNYEHHKAKGIERRFITGYYKSRDAGCVSNMLAPNGITRSTDKTLKPEANISVHDVW